MTSKIDNLANARTKDKATSLAVEFMDNIPEDLGLSAAQSEEYNQLKVLIQERLASCVNAAPAPEFLVPLSMQLICQMGTNLGPGWFLLLDKTAYCKFLGHADACYCLDPTTRREYLFAGMLGVMYGISVYTDAYAPIDSQRLLKRGHVYAMSEDGTKGFSVELA